MTISLSSFVQFFPLFQKVSLEERVRKKEIRDDYIYIYIYIRDTEFIIDYTRHERRGEERSARRTRLAESESFGFHAADQSLSAERSPGFEARLCGLNHRSAIEMKDPFVASRRYP